MDPSFAEVRVRFARAVARWVRFEGVAVKDRPDVEQLAWLQIERALPSYDRERALGPLLRTIVRRVAWAHLRLAHVRREELTASGVVPPLEAEPGLEAWSEHDPEAAAGVDPGPAVASDRHMEARIDAETVVGRVRSSLSKTEWQAFVLVDVEGMSGPEAAREVGVPASTVYTRLRRARRAIAATLARMEAAQPRRSRLFAWPAFLLARRDEGVRAGRWLRSRFVLGAVTGGVVVWALLHLSTPASTSPAEGPVTAAICAGSSPEVQVPPTAGLVGSSAEVQVASTAAIPTGSSAEVHVPPTVGLVGSSAGAAGSDAASTAGVGGARGVLAGDVATTGKGQAPGSSAAAASGGSVPKAAGVDPAVKERLAEASALLAMEAAQALVRNGRCEEAGRRLDAHADRLARGVLAPEYRELRRRIAACAGRR